MLLGISLGAFGTKSHRASIALSFRALVISVISRSSNVAIHRASSEGNTDSTMGQ